MEEDCWSLVGFESQVKKLFDLQKIQQEYNFFVTIFFWKFVWTKLENFQQPMDDPQNIVPTATYTHKAHVSPSYSGLNPT